MIGSSGTLVDRKGSYVIPKIEKTSTTKTYTMRLPYGAIILADNVTIISGADNLSYDNVTYTVKSEYADIKFSVPITEPVTSPYISHELPITALLVTPFPEIYCGMRLLSLEYTLRNSSYRLRLDTSLTRSILASQ